MELKKRIVGKACGAAGCKVDEGLVGFDVLGRGVVALCPAHLALAKTEGVAPPAPVEGGMVVRTDLDMSQIAEESRQVAGVLEHLQTVTIQTEQDLVFYNGILVEVKGRAKSLDTLRSSVLAPLNDAVKKIRAVFAAPVDGYARVEAAIKQRIQEYYARLDAERARAAAVLAQQTSTANQVEQALQVVAEHQRPQVQGLVVKDLIDFEIVSEAELPREYLAPNPAAIRSAISRGVREIPGVRIFSKIGLAARSA